jgi:predicted O-methyltransferase YrrM
MPSFIFFEKDAKEFPKFDTIFIDGDHSYDGVKFDFDNALPLLEEGGIIIFHDIASKACPGVVQLWEEIKTERSLEFIHSDTCGIGVWRK